MELRMDDGPPSTTEFAEDALMIIRKSVGIERVWHALKANHAADLNDRRIGIIP
jgi:hypothetical protein